MQLVHGEDVRAALAKALAATPADGARLVSLHNAEAVLRRLSAGTENYLEGMDHFVAKATEASLTESPSIAEGLAGIGRDLAARWRRRGAPSA